MRSPSSALVMAANQTSAIGVLFDVDYDVIVRNGCFQQGTTLKFLKYFRTFFVSILGQRHGVIIPVKPIRNCFEEWREILANLFFCLFVLKARVGNHNWRREPLFLYVLKACVWNIRLLFTCRLSNPRVDVSRPSKHWLLWLVVELYQNTQKFT